MSSSARSSRASADLPGVTSANPLRREPLWLYMMLAPLFWAGNSVLGRAVVQDGAVPPIGLAFWRWVLAALVLLPLVWPHLRRDWRAMWERPWDMLLLSALGIAAFNTLLYLGLRTTTALNGVMIQSAIPVMVAGLGVAVFGDRIRAWQWVGIGISLLGAAVLIGQGNIQTFTQLAFNAGDLYVLAAAVAYAGYTLMLRRRPQVHPLSLVFATFVIGAAMLAPFYLAESLGGHTMPFSAGAVGSVAYAAVCASVLAYLCFNRAVALAGSSVAGMCIHLVPVFGSLLAIGILGEQARLYHAMGIALIAAGILLASRRG